MKNILFAFSLVIVGASFTSNKNKSNSNNFNSIHEFIESKKSARLSETFPFDLVSEHTLPSFSTIDANKSFSFQTVIGKNAYLVNNEKYQVNKYNLESQQVTETLSFPIASSILSSKPASCFVMNEHQFLWQNESNVFQIYNSTGKVEKTVKLSLKYNKKSYHIATNANSKIQWEPQSQTLVFPVQFEDEYVSKDEFTFPKFLSYNLISGTTEFIPISLPPNYTNKNYLPLLYDVFTCIDGQTFYAVFPLSNEVYAYNFTSKQLSKVSIQLPVNLTDPKSLTQPTNPHEITESLNKCNHIDGFAVIDGKYYIQQTGAFSENLASKKFIDNTLLLVFNNDGSLLWGDKLQVKTFENRIFNLRNFSNKTVYFTSCPTMKSQKIEERFLTSLSPDF